MRPAVALSKRPLDAPFIVFFALNLFFITYVVDLEQLVITDPHHFVYPARPPAPLVDLVHWWGRNFDPALMARPPWWRATIWIDVVLFGRSTRSRSTPSPAAGHGSASRPSSGAP